MFKSLNSPSEVSPGVCARADLHKRVGNGLLPVLLFLVITCFGASCQLDANESSKRSFAKGVDFFEQEKYDPASLEFRKAIQAQPKNWESHYWLAKSALKLKHWQDAYKQLNVVIQLQPSFPAARL